MAPGFIDRPVPAPAKYLEPSIRIGEYAGLNGTDGFSIVDGFSFCPGRSFICGDLEVHLPAILFRAAGTNEFSIHQYRFILDRAQKSCRQGFSWAPGETIVT